MDRASHGFLIGRQAGYHVFCANAYCRERTVACNRRMYPLSRLRSATLDIAGDGGGCHHTPAHSFSMQQLRVTGSGLQRVAYGVAEVQNAAQIRLALVGTNHLGLYAHGINNEPLQGLAVALADLLRLCSHEIK